MHVLRVVMAGCLVVLSGVATEAAQKQSGSWLKDFAQAEQLSRETGRPLLVHFYADWCGPCRLMEQQILGQQDVLGKLGRDVIAVKVNTDHHKDLVTRFNIESLPSDVYVSPQGKVLASYVGSPGKAGWLARMAAVTAQFPLEPATAIAQAGEADSTVGKNGKKQPVDAPHPTASDLAAAYMLSQIGDQPGLAGYCPVNLLDDEKWISGRSDLTATYRGIVYRFGSEAERARFTAEPGKYAPQHMGCDLVALQRVGKAIPGTYQYAAFYQQRTYLFVSEQNRLTFLARPTQFTVNREVAGNMNSVSSSSTKHSSTSF